MTDAVYDVLRKHNAVCCIYELAGYHSPCQITADFTYVRLHGPDTGKYQGSYDDARLGGWARQIEDWMKRLKAIYVYFDNDQLGYAARNALSLRKMVFGSSRRSISKIA